MNHLQRVTDELLNWREKKAERLERYQELQVQDKRNSLSCRLARAFTELLWNIS